MGHAGLYLTLHLRVSAKAEGVPTLQQPPLFSEIDKIRPLRKAEGKSNLDDSQLYVPRPCPFAPPNRNDP